MSLSYDKNYVPPIIEKVFNIQGSTGTCGSGEYHRYRALRRRERTLAAVLEKQYKLKEEQKRFEEIREYKKEQLEKKTEKKRRKRNKANLFKKVKKINKKKIQIFDKNIPLVDQIKDELNQNINKEEISNENDDNESVTIENDNLENNVLDDDGALKPNLNAIKKNQKLIENIENENKYVPNIESKFISEDDIKNQKKLNDILQNKVNDIDKNQFYIFEDYEHHLEKLKFLEDKQKLENQIKYKPIDDIIIHEDD